MGRSFQTVKGTKDLLPADTARWREFEDVVNETMHQWGYGEIRTPVFEKTELFSRSVGEESDIVSKQMYTFTDQSDTSLTLRPELTAPTMRAYIQHNMDREGALTKLYYMDTLFRQERPQAGRLRQFSQFGAEAIGSPHPEQDAEVISLVCAILNKLGVANLTVLINTVGSSKSRERYRSELVNFLTPLKSELSEISQKRVETNPLRILDTKDEKEVALLSDAPDILNCLDSEDLYHFEKVQGFLTELGIAHECDNKLVRGLDYYSRTTFEITSPDVGAQKALCGGGRYDELIEQLGGKPTPAVGFAAGIERIMLALSEKQAQATEKMMVYFVTASESAVGSLFRLANELRQSGIPTFSDTLRRSVKAQMREANRLAATHAVIVGDEEIADNSAKVKDLATGEQTDVSMSNLVSHLKSL
ncbi:MAG TPA: histidine--tRNA ligase [Candidatus Marinimicrobia bacterium]|nr:histidine--tRNA ligase [Candidatus Neomarinimicrobiota bacterium]HIB71768.1 histidine--tRNA ligase [Candidatus Neomarinimicrobiota bacterium]HIB95265.1 histidine--tRNA ligase [Candidatus Neomarinimicrobiota bacterium]